MVKSTYDAVRKKTNEFADWILGYVPQSVKKPINEKVEKMEKQASDIFKRWHTERFEIHETEVALDCTARRYAIGGREGYDPMFLNAVETQVPNLIARSRQSRVYLVLSCDMGEA